MMDERESELTNKAFDEIRSELEFAFSKFPRFASGHEGYAILKEEVDELWDEVKKNPKTRNKEKMYNEAKQVAAMAIRFMVDV